MLFLVLYITITRCYLYTWSLFPSSNCWIIHGHTKR